jgi:hypothetical protein
VIASLQQWRGSPYRGDSLAYAQGEDSFGHFVSIGYMKPGGRITLARRCALVSDDGRAALSVEDVQRETLKAIYDEEEEDITAMPPWKCNILKV